MKRVRRHILVRVPGKLFVVGEYAALDGGSAIVAAIDRGVKCRVQAGDRVQTPTGDTRFVDAALQAVGAPTRQYLFEDWNPVDLPGKPGFGGSAAAVVAACAAGRAANLLRPDPTQLETIAIEVHRAVQGSGSGLDVRASVRGGVHRFASGEAAPVAPPELSVIWSGASASTGPRVARYLALPPGARATFCTRSDDLTSDFVERPVEVLEATRRLLLDMARQAGLTYETPSLARIAELARDHGGAAKPSGAGGGDVAVAVIPDPDARQAFEARCNAEGFTPIPVLIASGIEFD